MTSVCHPLCVACIKSLKARLRAAASHDVAVQIVNCTTELGDVSAKPALRVNLAGLIADVASTYVSTMLHGRNA
eukprot:4451463-Amphidinium_carterae.1